MEYAISVEDLHKSFGDKEILKGISLHAAKGEVTAIIGPSGSGKTTLLRSINLLETPDSGVITIGGVSVDCGKKIKHADALALRRQTAMVFQDYNLFKNKTALQNITQGLRTVKKKSKAEADEIARKQLELVGLSDFSDYYPIQLSGGQQQRVSIARALALNPTAILFDEPTSALDPELVGDVLEAIGTVAKLGITMVIVTHEIRFARKVADKVIFVNQGVIVEEGTAEEVIDHPTHERTKAFLSRINDK